MSLQILADTHAKCIYAISCHVCVSRGDRHLDHNYTDIPRRDNHVMNTRCHMDTRSRTCV